MDEHHHHGTTTSHHVVEENHVHEDGEMNPGHEVSHPSAKKGLSEDSFIGKLLEKNMPRILQAVYVIEDVIEQLLAFGRVANILYNKLYTKYAAYDPEAIVGMATGLCLIFFGGFFVVTVALVEAFKHSGSAAMFDNFALLAQQIKSVKAAEDADDKKDDDGDGIPDVRELTKEQLAERKIRVALTAMDPNVVESALGNMWNATLAACATVKLQFARTIALGVTIGNYINRAASRYLLPLLEAFTDKTYHKWYPIVFSYVSRIIGASIAFQIQRILSTVSTAIHGGHLFIDNFGKYCEARNIMYLSEGYLDDILVWVMVAIGIYSQLFLFTYLPFIIKLLFFPAFITEWLLTTLITTV
jgi:hypothetical protein